MTVLVGLVSFLMATVLVLGTITVGNAAVRRSRAQAAADAAALAAAAEAAAVGHGDPSGVAARYARFNGGRLLSCLCVSGATAAQVRVSVGDATARARAVFDPERVAAVDAYEGLEPRLSAAVGRLLQASGGRVRMVSGYRTREQQELLWQDALARYGDADRADDWVARPGTSPHERGVAVDLGGDLALAIELIDRMQLPLVRPLPHEPWHFELR